MINQLLSYQFFSGTFAGFIIALVPIIIFTRTQLKIAREAASNDLMRQEQRILSDRLKDDTNLEREKLEDLHKILSHVTRENSLTMSYFQSDSNLEISDFRKIYSANCARLDDARAIIAIYFPEMIDESEEINGETNKFWGYQENVLRIDINTNREMYQLNLENVNSAVKKISKSVQSLKNQITRRAKQIKEDYLGRNDT